MVSSAAILDTVAELERTISRGLFLKGRSIKDCDALSSWIDNVKSELTEKSDETPDDFPNLAKCRYPELLLSTVHWRPDSSGWQYLLPVMVSWGYFWWVEREFKSSGTRLSLFSWWTHDGGPLGLGPAGLSLVILLAVVFVAISVSRSARRVRSRSTVRSELTSQVLEMCTLGTVYREQQLGNGASELTSAAQQLEKSIGNVAVVKPVDIYRLQSASSNITESVKALDNRMARLTTMSADWTKALASLDQLSTDLSTSSAALTESLGAVRDVSPAARQMAGSLEEATRINTALRTNIDQFASSWAAALEKWRQEVTTTELRASSVDSAEQEQKALETATTELAGRLGDAVERAADLQRSSRDLLERSLIMLSMVDAAEEPSEDAS